MEPALKQRLLGAAVLVALAVVFLPLLVTGPAPDSGASTVSLKVPPPPTEASGDTRTFDLPLAAPAASAPALPVTAPPSATPATPEAPAPATAAAGDYAVNFGSYATEADAGRVIAALAKAGLPAWQEAAALGTRTVHRVRIGPFTTAADAQAARLAAGRVRSDVDARVVVLDAANGASPATSTRPATALAPPTGQATATSASTARTTPAPTAPPVATTALPDTTTVSAGTARTSTTPPKPATPPAPPAPAAPSPAPAASGTGFAIQLGAFAKADEADRLRDRARAAGFPAFVEQVQTDHGVLSRVRVGPVIDRAAADALRGQVRAKLGVDGIVRPHPG